MSYHRSTYAKDSHEGLPAHAVERLKKGRPDGKPFFTSDLSVNEFVLLHEAGFEPLGLVMGTSVYHVAHRGLGQWWKQVMQNAEMTNFTQALYDAREMAIERMQDEGITAGADGIVGVTIEERTYGWDAHVIEYFAVGTSITGISGSMQQPIPSPTFIISLNDPLRTTVVRSAPSGAAAATGGEAATAAAG